MNIRNKFSFRLSRIGGRIVGAYRHNRVDAFWEFRYQNSGDFVTPLLLKWYGMTPVHCYPNDATFFSCGSIMEKVPEDFSGTIIGTGFMYEDSIKSLKNAHVLAVRGPLTRDKLGAPKGTALGDPGLLISRLLKKTLPKKYMVGIVPHFVDKDNEHIHRICDEEKGVKLIDIQKPLLKVVQDISECEYILSSALHGIIFADSLLIPNVWLVLSDRVSGKGFKFRDYNLALGKEQEPVELTGSESISGLIARAVMPRLSVVEGLKDGLDHAYHVYKNRLQ